MSRGDEMKDLSRTKGYYAISTKRGMQSLLLALSRGLPHVLVGVEGSNANVRRFVDGERSPASELIAYVSVSADEALDALPLPEIADAFGNRSSCALLRARNGDGAATSAS